MSTNDLFLLMMFVVAALDIVYGTFILPKLVAKNPKTTEKTVKTIQMACYGSAGFMLVVGFVIHHLDIIK